MTPRTAHLRCMAFKASPVVVLATTAFVASATVGYTHGSRRAVVSSGLRNLGNTCYLNSQLQCAFHIPRVRELILSPPRQFMDEVDPANDDESESKPPTEDSIGLKAIRQVFEDMKQLSESDFPSPVAPAQFCRSLGIPVMEQQDAQEFWKLLLPALKLPQLVDLYQGAYEDYITAVDGSGRERRREEPFLDLSLDVTRSSLLQSLLDMFGTPELLSEKEGNGWRPEKGAPKVDALKGSLLRVAGLPSLLQCHLKRFQYDWQTDVMSKLNDRFSFPNVLDLSTVCTDAKSDEQDDPTVMYDLQAVVVHVGDYGSGHYYSYVRPDIRSDDWYRFNDDVVTQVTFDEVISDSYGGRVARKAGDEKRGVWQRLFGGTGSHGWGGRTSSAYMLQYVRRCDIPELYAKEEQ